MASKWNVWLSELSRASKGGVRLVSARRGSAFSQAITLPGDYSAASFRGEVRANPDASGTALAAFTFTTPTYDAGTGKTSVSFSLAAGSGANSTGALPADGDFDGVEEFPFDILVTPSGGTEELLFGGVLPVVGRVTV